MQFLNFTPQEIKALLFLLIALLIGSGVTFYKKYHLSFAPELILERPSPVPFENQSQFNEDPKDTESHSQDASPTHADPRLGKRVDISPHEIAKGSTTSPISNRQKENRISPIHENPSLKIPPKAGKKKIDLNSATAYQLELLPGIGPVLSLRIINHRETKGKFQKIEDVMKVSGIGPKTFEKIKDLITVE